MPLYYYGLLMKRDKNESDINGFLWYNENNLKVFVKIKLNAEECKKGLIKNIQWLRINSRSI